MKKLLFLTVIILPILGYYQSIVFCPKIDISNMCNIEGNATVVFNEFVPIFENAIVGKL